MQLMNDHKNEREREKQLQTNNSILIKIFYFLIDCHYKYLSNFAHTFDAIRQVSCKKKQSIYSGNFNQF